jgi:hypothetical protein
MGALKQHTAVTDSSNAVPAEGTIKSLSPEVAPRPTITPDRCPIRDTLGTRTWTHPVELLQSIQER